MPNQNPEQIARDKIDAMLEAAGWVVQGHRMPNLNAGIGVALREYPTDAGPMDYLKAQRAAYDSAVDGLAAALAEAGE